MWFHSKFVVLTLMGKQIKWGPQSRTDNETGWTQAIRMHGFSTLLALGWILGISSANPAVSIWLWPVAVALLLSIPLAVYSSRATLGRTFRRWRLFVIPEELAPPQVIKNLHAALARRQPQERKLQGFLRAAIDPEANAVHVGLLRRKELKSPQARARNKSLREKALQEGLASLTPAERAYLLKDAESLATLHRNVWQTQDRDVVAEAQAAKLADPVLYSADRRSDAEPQWETV
jgi:membrane glycosyltransferase